MKKRNLLGSMLLASTLLPVSLFATGSESSYYFRCNSTSWQTVEESRLKPAEHRSVSLVYEVKDDAVGSYGEDCALTETPEVNAWGAWQKDFDLNGSVLNTNAYTAIGDGSDYRPFNFKVNYSGRGTYKVALNLDSKQVLLSRVDGAYHAPYTPAPSHPHVPAPVYTPAPAPVAGESHWYLRCASTSYDAAEVSRFKPVWGDVMALDINVTNEYFVSHGDDCHLTQTNALNAWGTWQQHYNLDGVVLDSSNFAYLGGFVDDLFNIKVKYSYLGAHKAYLNPKTSQVWVR